MKPIIVNLDRPRTIKFSYKAIRRAEALLGMKLSSLDSGNLGIEDLAKILYAGICAEDPELTFEAFENLLDEHMDLQSLGKVVEEAFGDAMPKNG